MIFALVGNQNCGKTTLFNALTGSNQHVGNFPGVTVDQKVGEVKGAPNCSVVDLPGIYSIRPYSQEEIVTRDFVLGGKPDGIINIVDATNIERNLYLTLQLLELRIPTVVALNMMDELTGNGGSVDIQKMSKALGVPVVPISAAKNEGVSELTRQFVRVAKERILPKVMDFCPVGPVHRCIHAVSHLIEDHAQRAGVSPRFCATKLIEGDESFLEMLELRQKYGTVVIANLGGHSEEEYVEGAAMLSDSAVDIVELNISCPNVKVGGMAYGVKAEAAGEVVRMVRDACKKPLMVKLSPQAENIPEMCKAVEAAGADAISLTNTFQACAIDLEKRKPVFNNIFAGLSGPAVRPIALRMVWQAVGAVNIPVVGLGGIATGRDALEFIMAGATAVQVGAANFANPRAMETIAEEMAAWMDKNGVKTLDEIRGCARSNG